MLDPAKFSSHYQVRKLTTNDIPTILALCEKNVRFYEHCPPFATARTLEADMAALPQRKSGHPEDKYYLGYFERSGRLAAVLDLIDHYPTEQSCFIGFFMMESALQGQGRGSQIITELCNDLTRQDYQFIRLGYVDGNKQSEHFWKKNQFTDTAMRNHTDAYTVIVMNRNLK